MTITITITMTLKIDIFLYCKVIFFMFFIENNVYEFYLINYLNLHIYK